MLVSRQDGIKFVFHYLKKIDLTLFLLNLLLWKITERWPLLAFLNIYINLMLYRIFFLTLLLAFF